MKIILKFSEQSKSITRDQAIRIAEANEHYRDGGFIVVHFDAVTPDLRKLLEIVKSWKTTEVYIDNEELPKDKAASILLCKDQYLCDGACSHLRLGFFPLSRFLLMLRRDPRDSKKAFVDRFSINELAQYGALTKVSETEFALNRPKLQDTIREMLHYELEYCPKINPNKISELLNGIPEVLVLRDTLIDVPLEHREGEAASEADIKQIWREQAEVFADAIEERLRKLLKEFMKPRSEQK